MIFCIPPKTFRERSLKNARSRPLSSGPAAKFLYSNRTCVMSEKPYAAPLPDRLRARSEGGGGLLRTKMEPLEPGSLPN